MSSGLILKLVLICFLAISLSEVIAQPKKVARSCSTNLTQIVNKEVKRTVEYYLNKYLNFTPKKSFLVSLLETDFFDCSRVEVKYKERAFFTRGSVIFKDRDAGIRDLVELSKVAKTEAGWVFIPRYRVWINVTVAASDRSITLHDEMIRSLTLMDDEVELFHIHPLSTTNGLPHEFLILPSYNDLQQVLQLNEYVDRSRHGFGLYQSTIISAFGLTTLRINPKLLGQRYRVKFEINLDNEESNPNKHKKALGILTSIESQSLAFIDGTTEPINPLQINFKSADEFKENQ